MNKRGLLLGATLVLGINVGLYNVTTEEQGRKISKFIQEYPAIWFGGHAAAIWILGNLFSKSAVSAGHRIVLSGFDDVLWSRIRENLDVGNSVLAEITPSGDVLYSFKS